MEMNARELADLLERCNDWGYNQDAANMLRAQADLINCLRMGQPNIDYDKELLKPTFVGRELTDEEIDMLAHEYNCIDDYPHEFVRACIRKAQE